MKKTLKKNKPYPLGREIGLPLQEFSLQLLQQTN